MHHAPDLNRDAIPDPALGRPLPAMQELLAHLVVVSLPMTVSFRGLIARETALVRGPLGWAEFAPFAEYDDAESARWLVATCEAGWWGWPEPVRSAVPINATVPAVAAGRVPEVLARFPGTDTAKVKVAEATILAADPKASDAADLARVAAVRKEMGPGARIRIDANGGWTLERAAAMLRQMAQYDLEYAEQPCASVAELAALRIELHRRGIPMRIAADESIRRAVDPLAVRDAQAADLLVVKAAPLGGVAAAQQIVDRSGLPVVVSSALESSVGLTAGVALAASLKELAGACGLATARLFTEDVTSDPLVPDAHSTGSLDLPPGHLPLRRVEADARHLVARPERRDAWSQRIRRCWHLLAAG